MGGETPMDINITILLANRSGTVCDHCERKDEWGRDLRFRSLREQNAVSCPGCHVPACDGKTGMTTLCEDCLHHRFSAPHGPHVPTPTIIVVKLVPKAKSFQVSNLPVMFLMQPD